MARRIIGGVALAAVGLSAPAGWALTAQEAWDTWKTLATEAGQTVSAESETAEGGRLTVSGVAFSAEMQEMTMSGRIPEIVFSENGDGSVAITMSDAYALSLGGESDVGESVQAVMGIAAPGLAMTASETDGGVRYDYQAPSIGVTLDSLVVDGEDVPFDMTFALDTVSGHYTGASDGSSIQQSVNAAGATVDIKATNPETDGRFSLGVTARDLVSDGTGTGLLLYSGADLPAMLQQGMSTDGSASAGETAFAIDFAEGAETFQATGGMSGLASRISLNADRLDAEQSYRGFFFTASGSEIPFPQVTGSLGEWTTNLSMPLTPTDAATPFDLRLVLGDLAIGEEIWSMIDPAGAIPRDPATLVLDVQGMARLLVSLLDEEAVAAAAEPAQIEALTINDMRLTIAGAELTGAGAFTFDNADRATFGGMPAPEGSVNLKLTGGNTLLDRLVQMGLVPQEQAMMTRMMTGMLAKPGEGADTLVSEITVRPDGSVLANGAPLPF